jgi:hypothetical protein
MWASIIKRDNRLFSCPRRTALQEEMSGRLLPGRVIPFSLPVDNPYPDAKQRHIVVQIGRDEELLRLRAMVISSAGYTVHSMTPDQATAELKKAQGVHVWVFCHTLECFELALLAVAIRKARPWDKLLRLTGLNDVREMPGLFDELLEPVTGVDDLLKMIAHLAKP